MKWGGAGEGPRGGGPGCCTEVHGVDGVQGGGGDPRHTQHHTQHYTNTPRVKGGGVGPAGYRPSSLQLYTKVQKLNSYCFEIFLDYIFGKLKSCTDML